MRSAIVTGTLAVLALGLTQACASDDGEASGQPMGYGGFAGNNTGGLPGTGNAPNTGGNAPNTGGYTPNTGGYTPNTGGINAGGGPGTGGVGTGGTQTTGGMGATPGTGGAGVTGGVPGTGGAGVTGGTPSTGGSKGDGKCCSDGDCLCRDEPPSALTASAGKYRPANYRGTTGTIYYPSDAQPPFSAIAICAGFTNTGPEMNPWATFYASHGIVTLVTTTGGLDDPTLRGTKLAASIAELKSENTKSGGQLNGKLAGRYGTSGYSMGGGGTTVAASKDKTLLTSIGIAPWGPVGAGVSTPTLLLCGTDDTIAACNLATEAYRQMTGSAPKALLTIEGVSHLEWFNPTVGNGTAGKWALAFQKVYLEGDDRWKPLLMGKPPNGTMQTANVQ